MAIDLSKLKSVQLASKKSEVDVDSLVDNLFAEDSTEQVAQEPIIKATSPAVPNTKEEVQPKEDGFWNTYLGDTIEKIGAGLNNYVSNTAGWMDKGARKINDLVGDTSGAHTSESGKPVSGAFGDISKSAKKVATGLRADSDRYKGKKFGELWKDDKAAAIGDIFLQASESLAPSMMAAFTGPLGVPSLGASAANEKYDVLDESNPNMAEVPKMINALLTGTAEAGSEYLGSVPVGKWLKGMYSKVGSEAAQAQLQKGLAGWIGNNAKKLGVFFPPVAEGTEEIASQVAENITDWATGARPDFNPMEGVLESFVYGAGGGAQFSAMSLPSYGMRVADKAKTGYDLRKATKSFDSLFQDENAANVVSGLNSMSTEEQASWLEAVSQSPDYSEEQKKAAADLLQSSLSYNARRSPEEYKADKENRDQLFIDTEMRNFDSYLSPMIAENGMIQQVKIGDEEVYITKGDISLTANEVGKPVFDPINSSDQLYYTDKDGNTQVTSSKMVTEVLDVQDSEALRQQHLQNVMYGLEQRNNQSSQMAQEVTIENGDPVQFLDPSTGKMVEGIAVDTALPDVIQMEDGRVIPREQVMPNLQSKDAVINPPADETKNDPILAQEGVAVEEEQAVPGSPVIDYLKDKEGNADYDNIDDPLEYAAALTAEYPGEELDIINQDLEFANQELESAKNVKSAIESRKKMKVAQDKIDRLNSFKAVFDTNNKVVDPIEQADPLEDDQESIQDIDLSQLSEPERRVHISQNSNDPLELADLYDQVKDEFEVSQMMPWEAALVGRKISKDSFIENSDKNNVTGAIAKSWFADKDHARKAGLDVIAAELSEYGTPVTENDIVEFVLSHPNNNVKKTNQVAIDTNRRFKEVVKALTGENVGGLESTSGKLVLAGLKAGVRSEQEKQAQPFNSYTVPDAVLNFFEETGLSPDDFDSFEALNDAISIELEKGTFVFPLGESDLQTINNIVQHGIRQQGNYQDFASRVEKAGIQRTAQQPIFETAAAETAIQPITGATDTATDTGGIELQPEIIPEEFQEQEQEQPEELEYTPEEMAEIDAAVSDNRPLMDVIKEVAQSHEITQAEKQVNIDPTEAQKEAGNYKMGHVSINGFDVTIENPKGSTRSGVDAEGKPWSIDMANSYGYIKGTKGKDGDHVDVFVGNSPLSDKVFVVDQINKDGSFDEHKVMMGFNSIEEAQAAYLANYEQGWTGLGSITEMSVDEFRSWVKDGVKSDPVVEVVEEQAKQPVPTVMDEAKEATKKLDVEDSKNKPSDQIPIDNNIQPISSEEVLGVRGETNKAKSVKSKAAPSNDVSVQAEKIEDFGEKIGGAKKDLVKEYRDRMGRVTEDDVLELPLSKSFPRPDFKKLVEEGVITENQAIYMSYLYDKIESKPRQANKAGHWASRVHDVITMFNETVDGKSSPNLMEDAINKMRGYNPVVELEMTAYMDIMKKMGFPNNPVTLGQYSITQLWNGSWFYLMKGKYVVKKSQDYKEIVNMLAELLEQPKAKKEVKLSIYRSRKSGLYYIGKSIPGKDPVKLSKDFNEQKEVVQYLKDNNAELVQLWEKMNVNPEERRESNRTRKGTDWRGKKDVTPELFGNTFGFRGVEFGNWVNKSERQSALNDAYDALMDLSSIIGVSPKALSLGGGLSLAFGARGGSKASAHYEPSKVVINLTKTKGAGSLAHEWFHALDNYFSKRRGENGEFMTKNANKRNNDTTRQELLNAFEDLVATIYESDMRRRSNRLDATRSKAYWGQNVEMAARAFESYVIDKLNSRNEQNDYLANVKSMNEWSEGGAFDISSYPYPNETESPVIGEKFDQLFQTIEEKEDEDGNQILFRDGASETDKIKAEAEKNGTFLKAPNGKGSILNEKQWLHVRTKAFKDWFGDWEKAYRIEKLRKSNPVEITGDEIEPSNDLKQYKKNALEYGKTIRGEYTNKDSGASIIVSAGTKRGGIREILQHDYKDIEHLQSIAAIPKIIEDSIFVEELENEDSKAPDVSAYHYYVCGLKINDADYTVKAVVAVSKNGERYYDHKLTKIEKGKLLSTLPEIQKSGEESNQPLSDIKDKRLISILKVNSSKVVDENGEPLVMYRGHDASQNSYSTKLNTPTFTSSKEAATVYSEDHENGVVTDAFVNTKNPLSIGDEYGSVTIYDLKSLLPVNVFESIASSVRWMYSGDHATLKEVLEDAKDNKSALKEAYTETFLIADNRDFVEWAQSQGYDGFIYKGFFSDSNSLDDDFLSEIRPFNENQIKSSTDNNGNFDSYNDDIRYKENADKQRMSEWLSKQRYNSAEVEKLFGHDTNILDSFDNSDLEPGNISSEVEQLYPSQNNSVRIIHDINDQFNKELIQQIEGVLPKDHIYKLGMPSEALLSAGIPSFPIELKSERLGYKSTSGKHDYDISEVVGLPNAIANPIAIFKYGDEKKAQNIITELEHNGEKFLVGISITPKIKGHVLEINSVRNVFPKNSESIVDWINGGKMLYSNKEKLLSFLDQQRTNHADVAFVFPNESVKQGYPEALLSATNIVNSFENPTLEQGNILSEIETLSSLLNTPVRIVRDVNEISDKDRDIEKRMRKSRGWYDTRTGEVVIVFQKNRSVADAQKTVLHEVVGHLGLRKLLGSEFAPTMESIFDSLPTDLQVVLNQKYGSKVLSAEEYASTMAETMSDPGIIQRIVSAFKDAMRKLGVKLKMTDGDIMNLLWKSKNRLTDGDTAFEIMGKMSKAESVKKETESFDRVFRDSATLNDTMDEMSDDPVIKAEMHASIKSKSFQWQEGYQDRMLAVKKLQELLEKHTGKKLPDHMNVYIFENTLSSRNTYEIEQYKELYTNKMMENVKAFISKGYSMPEVENYVIAKHGLERNDYFRINALLDEVNALEKNDAYLEWLPDAIRSNSEKFQARVAKDKAALLEEIGTRKFSEIEGLSMFPIEKIRQRLAKRDFAGITALEKELEMSAQEYIDITEGRFENETKELWKSINAATKASLKKWFDSGMINKEVYNKINGMYEYYVPLRGFAEDTAADVYEYFTEQVSPFNNPLKKAYGRKSKPETPFAHIVSAAGSSIVGGNKNIMKLHLLRLAQNNPSDYMTVNKAWYVDNGQIDPETNKPIYDAVFPEYSENMDEYRANVEEFEAEMEELKAQGIAFKGTKKLKPGYKISKVETSEHMVRAMLNGEEHFILVHGDPRVAQAINGLNDTGRQESKFMKAVAWSNRQMAANFTTRNPSFIASNLVRDVVFASTALSVKEGSKYTFKFEKNVFGGKAGGALGRFLKGKPNYNNEADVFLKEFLENGGETGYTALYNIDKYKKMIARSVEVGTKASIKDSYMNVVDIFSNGARWAEDLSRFSVYMTSRQSGRTILKSVNDAKEVTVNFNRKGSGSHGAGFARGAYLFFNAAIQSLSNAATLIKKEPVKASAAMLGFASVGYLIPVIVSMLGDDDDLERYNNLPDYVRKNHLCIPMGDGFVKIPLPIELRAFYGLGDQLYRMATGSDHMGESLLNMALSFMDMLPLNPVGGGDTLGNLLPDALVPVYQSYGSNKDFTGKPIARVTPFNEFDPEYLKVYKNANVIPVYVSQLLNSVSGGDDVKKGGYDKAMGIFGTPVNFSNPAAFEHLFESYFGGLWSTTNQLMKTAANGVGIAKDIATGEDNFDWSESQGWRTTPILNRFIDDGKSNGAMSKINDRYFKAVKEMKETKYLIRGYEEKLDSNLSVIEAMKVSSKIAELESGKIGERMYLIEDYTKDIESLNKESQDVPKDKRSEIVETMNDLKSRMLEKLKEIDNRN